MIIIHNHVADVLQSHDVNRDVIKELKRHIVLCTFSDERSPEMGLINFVAPLRASCLKCVSCAGCVTSIINFASPLYAPYMKYVTYTRCVM